ncbi:hypothetical protein [Nonomuraea rhodomycinica]|uniref:Uncharacterized protein n=1 Tax=Nonomuraea rhodomycinica TaxID=1712872 RepID=A0A7Y6IRL5_9ACTN|nr:hypothetical protein [Nonomuraea rhodomycinica]NUW42945.1 hypothetical protein [Nonomuraea rhodomycinica]
MLSAVAESDEPARQKKPSDDHVETETISTYGTALLVLGGALCGGALLIGDGEPTWQILGVFMLVALTGLVLRIEAAIRSR